jgi:hypothetical protein
MPRRHPRTSLRSCRDLEREPPQCKLAGFSQFPKMRGFAGISDGWRSYMRARNAHMCVTRVYAFVFSVRLLQTISPQIPATEVNEWKHRN